MVTPIELEQATTAATAFLESKRGVDGLWRDFHTLAGASSDWVSGFVAYAIARGGQQRASVLQATKELVFRQRPNGGWSYNRAVPTDCDSTAWVLMALSTVPNWRPSAIKRATQYLKAHRDGSTGGFSTYAPHDRIDRFIDVSDPELTRGWLCAHPCVTSVTLQCLLLYGETVTSDAVQLARAYLEDVRDATHVWRSYWWQGYSYNTYHALRALSMARAVNKQQVCATLHSLCQDQQADGGWRDSPGEESQVFATAFVLLALLLFPNNETLTAAKHGVAWLLRHQNGDGSWPTVPILRIPPPMVKDPESVAVWRMNQAGTGVVIEDPGRVFTSAAALWALAVFKSITQ